MCSAQTELIVCQKLQKKKIYTASIRLTRNPSFIGEKNQFVPQCWDFDYVIIREKSTNHADDTFFKEGSNKTVWLHCDVLVLVVQQVGFLLRAALLSVLLCCSQQVVSDSDEAVLTEWEIWKSSHGISHADKVRLTPHLHPYVSINSRYIHMSFLTWASLWFSMCYCAGWLTKEDHLGEEQADDWRQ